MTYKQAQKLAIPHVDGFWRGARYASRKSLQDILILDKIKKNPDNFVEDSYLEIHEDVKNSGMSPKFYRLALGFDESEV